MSSFFNKKKQNSRKVNIIVPEKTALEAGFNIKENDTKEIDECIDTMSKTMPQVRWNTEGLRRNFYAPNSLTLIARYEGPIVGVINGTVSLSPLQPPVIGLMIIFDQTSGQLGLGGYLVDSFISSLKKRSPKSQCVDVSLPSIDTGSIALYSLKGFLVEGFVKDGFNQPLGGQESHDLVILRRYLTASELLNVV